MSAGGVSAWIKLSDKIIRLKRNKKPWIIRTTSQILFMNRLTYISADKRTWNTYAIWLYEIQHHIIIVSDIRLLINTPPLPLQYIFQMHHENTTALIDSNTPLPVKAVEIEDKVLNEKTGSFERSDTRASKPQRKKLKPWLGDWFSSLLFTWGIRNWKGFQEKAWSYERNEDLEKLTKTWRSNRRIGI